MRRIVASQGLPYLDELSSTKGWPEISPSIALTSELKQKVAELFGGASFSREKYGANFGAVS